MGPDGEFVVGVPRGLMRLDELEWSSSQISLRRRMLGAGESALLSCQAAAFDELADRMREERRSSGQIQEGKRPLVSGAKTALCCEVQEEREAKGAETR